MPASPRQLAWRGRIEAVLRLTAPALDLLLLAGEQLSKKVEPTDREALEPAPVAEPARTGRRRQVGAGS
jgi:hypothetical protein